MLMIIAIVMLMIIAIATAAAYLELLLAVEHVGLVPLALLDQLSECVAVGVGRADCLDTLRIQPLDEAAAGLRGTGGAQVVVWDRRRQREVLLVSMGG